MGEVGNPPLVQGLWRSGWNHHVELYQLHFPYPPEEIQTEIANIDLDFRSECVSPK
ncbi:MULTISPECIES: hypothetical protein [unclassified Anabaena]|uniref:hypothetical protein n=1 Tax=unclassified Anabaena TaxID=2619674 RepID=UPI0039C63C7F